MSSRGLLRGASVFALTGVACLLSACASSSDPVTQRTPSSSPSRSLSSPPGSSAPTAAARTEPWAKLFAVSRNADDAPEEIRGGSGRINCGEMVLKLKVPREKVPTATRTCFESRIGKAAAEIAVITQTVEGDPVVSFYLTSARSPGYDVVVDWRWDNFGPGGWSGMRCANETTFDTAAASCRPR